MERHDYDCSNSKTQCKRAKNHIIDKLQDTHTDQRTNHNQVKAACLKENKFDGKFIKMPGQTL